jgi:spoIIIJ-associated protein
LDAALDQLGVDEDEVEYEILEEPRSGLFARLGGSRARVRARVKPLSREKPGDRGRNRSGRGRRSDGGRNGRSERPAPTDRPAARDADGAQQAAPPRAGRGRRGSGRNRQRSAPRQQEEIAVTTTTDEEVPIGEQADVADEFMRGLVGAFGVQADVSVRIDGDAVLVDVEGEDLGLLVGQRGATLRAIEDLVRTVVQRRTDGHGARIHVDVAGYQAKRRAALERFATELAQRVVESGQELALEPMPPADRKVVHDTVANIDGVVTISEGEEPRRRVVVRPA